MQKRDLEGSRFGLWNAEYDGYEGGRKLYGNDLTTAKMAAEYLAGGSVVEIEDWGCGYGGFKKFVRDYQQYVGVDGSSTPFADVVADLTTYRSTPDGLLLRHVLEHNPKWLDILRNALASFRKRMVIVVFTPFMENTKIVGRYPSWHGSNSGIDMIDIGFKKYDLTNEFGRDVVWTEETVETASQYSREHLFYFERPLAE